ncbi:MAG: hypothetical protein K6G56_02600 [Clostridiales bacterium]|nr:hypothetical protein [Clostridiales bacterium]
MRRALSFFCIIICIAVLMSGCVRNTDRDEPFDTESPNAPGLPGSTDRPGVDDAFTSGVCWTRAADSFSFVETEAAYIGTDHNDCLLRYWDKQSGESGPLCGKPECDHTTAECGAMIFSGNSSLTYYGGKLWWLGRNFDEDHPIPNDQKKRGLWRMDPDGTNREYLGRGLTDFAYGENYASAIAFYMGYIFLLTNRDIVSGGVPSVRYSVFRTAVDDLESYDELFSFSCTEEETVMGSSLWCVENRVIAFYRIAHEREEGYVYSARVYSYDIASGEAELVFDGEDPMFSFYSAAYYNGAYYFAGRATIESENDERPIGIGAVFILDGGSLVKCFDFADEDAISGAKGGVGGYTSATVSGGVARAHYKLDDKDYEVWYKSLETGETLYKGKWELGGLPGYEDGRLSEWLNIGGDGESTVMLVYFLVGDTEYYSFVKYTFDENGMTETLLFSGEYAMSN